MPRTEKDIKDKKEKLLRFKARLFPGATAFIFIVIFFNIMRKNRMTWLDWAIIFLGVLVFFYTLFAAMKHKKTTRER